MPDAIQFPTKILRTEAIPVQVSSSVRDRLAAIGENVVLFVLTDALHFDSEQYSRKNKAECA